MARLYVVMNLVRWQGTTISLSFRERLVALIRGRIDLDENVEGHGTSVGWVPVFPTMMDAMEFVDDQAPGAQVLETQTPDLS